MKKMGVLLLLLVMSVVGVYKVQPYYASTTFNAKENPVKDHNTTPYYLTSSHKIKGYFDNLEAAIDAGKQYQRAVIIDANTKQWVWNNYQPFIIATEYGIQDFNTFDSAMFYAKRNGYDQIHWRSNSNVIWDKNYERPERVILDVPVIQQYPELPRGCEVTSLAMVLQYQGVDADKLKLAQEVKKDPTPYSIGVDGKIHFGNPYTGFVGDMYNINNNGYGVYHGPIADLAKQYKSKEVMNLTGVNIEILLSLISNNMPIWVVANSTYKPLDENMFEIWHTPTGITKITYREHAVVMTGYSDQYIYINDPLRADKNIPVNRDDFIKAWIQMGSQAVTIYNQKSN